MENYDYSKEVKKPGSCFGRLFLWHKRLFISMAVKEDVLGRDMENRWITHAIIVCYVVFVVLLLCSAGWFLYPRKVKEIVVDSLEERQIVQIEQTAPIVVVAPESNVTISLHLRKYYSDEEFRQRRKLCNTMYQLPLDDTVKGLKWLTETEKVPFVCATLVEEWGGDLPCLCYSELFQRAFLNPVLSTNAKQAKRYATVKEYSNIIEISWGKMIRIPLFVNVNYMDVYTKELKTFEVDGPDVLAILRMIQYSGIEDIDSLPTSLFE